MKETNELNALRLRRKYDTNKPRKNFINVCNARANWNACDYIDYHLQEFDNAYGALCWEQSRKHNCCYCVEIQAKS